MNTKDSILELKRAGTRNCEIAGFLSVSKQYVSYICRAAQNGNKPKGGLESNGYLTVGGASRLLGVHEATIRRWSDQGKIPSFRVDIGRRDRRFKILDIRKLAVSSEAAGEMRPPDGSQSLDLASTGQHESVR